MIEPGQCLDAEACFGCGTVITFEQWDLVGRCAHCIHKEKRHAQEKRLQARRKPEQLSFLPPIGSAWVVGKKAKRAA